MPNLPPRTSLTPKNVRRAAIALAAGGVLALAACSASSSGAAHSSTSGAAATSSAPPVSSASARTVQVHSGAIGSYLTDGAGRSLYMFAADSPNKSACTGTCLTYWPTLTAPAGAGPAAVKADLSMIKGAAGNQVTYHGHPLYYYSGDSKSGQTNGQGLSDFGARWWLLSPAGQPITTTSGASSSSSGGGGYGY